MRILQVNKFFYPKGGSETYFLNLCDLLAQHGHEIIHFAMQSAKNRKSPYSQYFPSSLDIESPRLGVGAITAIPRSIWSQEAAQKLEKLILEQKPEIAHLHNIDRHLTPSIIP